MEEPEAKASLSPEGAEPKINPFGVVAIPFPTLPAVPRLRNCGYSRVAPSGPAMMPHTSRPTSNRHKIRPGVTSSDIRRFAPG